MRLLALFAGLAVLMTAGLAAAHSPSPPAAISTLIDPAPEAVLEAFHAAVVRGDAAAAADALDETLLVFEEGWVDAGKAAFVRDHLPEDIAYLKTMTETQVSRTGGVSGDLAWIATQGRMQGVHDGKPVDRDTAETVILKRTNGVWKIVQIHWSSHARKP